MPRMTTYGRHFVELASEMGPIDARAGAREALRFYRCLEQQVFVKGYDALLTPTVATTRIGAAYDPTREVLVIGGKRVDPYVGWFLTSIFSLLNWMPVMCVPSGPCANKVQCGMQIACRPYDDATAAALMSLFAAAAPPMRFEGVPG
jgi:amidase